MKRILLILGVTAAVLVACGSRKDPVTKPGASPPPVARGQKAAPTFSNAVKPPPYAAPNRVDDPLSNSQERPEDHFDLPPTG